MKKFLLTMVCVFGLLSQNVLANSGPIYTEGSTIYNIQMLEDSPISVESERLEFTLDEVDLLREEGRVKVEYHMKNNSDISVDSQVIFPIIDSLYNLAEKDVRIELDGAPLEYELYYGEVLDEFGEELEELNLNFEELRRGALYKYEIGEDLGSFNHFRPLFYKYDLNLEPNAEVVHTLEFPMRAFMNNKHTKQVRYTYLYLLTPASYWKDFKNLEIEVNTSEGNPFIVESSIPFEELGERKYRAVLDELPEEDLKFVVCEVEAENIRYKVRPLNTIILILAVPMLIVIGIMVYFIRRRRQK